MTNSVSFDWIAPRYDQTRNLDARRHLAGFLAPWLIPGPVLEVGVGTGQIAGSLRERGYDVVGVDLSMPMLRLAHERLGDNVACGDARALPIADGAVADVLFAASLLAIGDITRAIAEAARVLRHGGRLIATYDRPIITPESGATDDIMDAVAPLDGLAAFLRPDGKESLDAAANAAGLTTVRHDVSDQKPRKTTPEQFAQNLENRVFSVLLDIDHDSWERVVVPVIARLRALREPGRPRVRGHSYRFAVYQKEGAR